MTISTFSRAVELPASALRYYHEAGLLPPAEVDPQTGYRYYTPELARRAHLIRRMREVGVPVETMRIVLKGPVEDAVGILRDFAARVTSDACRARVVVEELVGSLQGADQEPLQVTITVDGAELAAAIRRVANASSPEVGSALNGVLLDITGEWVTVVATNRYWMAIWRIPCTPGQVATRRAFMAAAQAEQAREWLSGRRAVTLTVTDDSAQFTAGQETRSFATEQDRFPAYRMIEEGLPDPAGYVSVSVASLRSVIGQDAHGPPIRFAVGTDGVVLSRAGESEGIKLVAVAQGDPVVLWFSSRMLDQALATMVGTQVTVVYADTNQPVTITPTEQRRLSVVLMPASAGP